MRIEKGYNRNGRLQDHYQLIITSETEADTAILVGLGGEMYRTTPAVLYMRFFIIVVKRDMIKYELCVRMLDGFESGDKSLSLLNLRSPEWEIRDLANILIHSERIEII